MEAVQKPYIKLEVCLLVEFLLWMRVLVEWLPIGQFSLYVICCYI